MRTNTCWRTLLIKELATNGETIADIVSNTMDDQAMDTTFDGGFGGKEGCEFTVWTNNFVYFPVCYDGAEWVGSAPRNPNGTATRHQGGG